MSLTPKQEKFAREVASGKTQADAYRAAYSAGNMTDKTVIEKASRLMAQGNIRARVGEIQKPITERAQITLESHLADLKSLRNMAAKEKQIAAAISAEVARGKVCGYYVERKEHTGPGGGPIQSVSMTAAEFARIAAEVAAKV